MLRIRCRRQAGEIAEMATDEHARVCPRRCLKVFLRELQSDEGAGEKWLVLERKI